MPRKENDNAGDAASTAPEAIENADQGNPIVRSSAFLINPAHDRHVAADQLLNADFAPTVSIKKITSHFVVKKEMRIIVDEKSFTLKRTDLEKAQVSTRKDLRFFKYIMCCTSNDVSMDEGRFIAATLLSELNGERDRSRELPFIDTSEGLPVDLEIPKRMNIIEEVVDLVSSVSKGIDTNGVRAAAYACLLHMCDYDLGSKGMTNGLSIIILGGSTLAFKSTAVDEVTKVFRLDDEFSEGSTKALVDLLVDNHTAMMVKDEISGELGQWIKGSRGKEGMMQLTNVLMTGKPIAKMVYKSWSIDCLEDYKWSSIFATTFEGLDTMSESDEMMNGGYAVRPLYVLMNESPDGWDPMNMEWTMSSLLKKKMISEFIDLLKSSRAKFLVKLPDAVKKMHSNRMKEMFYAARDTARRHVARLSDSVFKIAIAHAISTYIDANGIPDANVVITLTEDDIDEGLHFAAISIKVFSERFESMNCAKELSKARKKLREKPHQTLRELYHSLGMSNSKEIEELLGILKATGEVTMEDGKWVNFTEYIDEPDAPVE